MRASPRKVDVHAWSGRLASVGLVPSRVCRAGEVGFSWGRADDVRKEDDLSGFGEVDSKELFELRIVARTDAVVVAEAFLDAEMYAESVLVDTVIGFVASDVMDLRTGRRRVSWSLVPRMSSKSFTPGEVEGGWFEPVPVGGR